VTSTKTTVTNHRSIRCMGALLAGFQKAEDYGECVTA
jgi:hypothetical protein